MLLLETCGLPLCTRAHKQASWCMCVGDLTNASDYFYNVVKNSMCPLNRCEAQTSLDNKLFMNSPSA